MNYTYLSGSDLELLYLSFMICFWILWEIPMNWFVCGEFMEKRTVFLCGLKVSWLKFLENFSAKGFKDQLLYQYVGSRIVGGTWWRKLLMVWIFGWLMGSLWIFWYMNSQAIEKRRETLANMCDERARMLQDQFNVSMNHVQALAILASTFHHGRNPSAIDQATFAKYTERTAFERPLTSGVAYAVRVLHSEREQFERQQGWTIKKMYEQEQNPVRKEDNTVENHEPSPIQPEYAPVIFAQDTVSHIVSFDMLTGKEDRENIIRARASGKGVLTAPFRLLKSNRLGVILTFAVYKKELPPNVKTSERIQATDGYIGGIFDIESLVEKLLHQLASKQTIIVNVYDTTNKSEPISMYGSGKRDDAIYHISSLHFGDPFRRHEMHCRFKKDQPVPWLAITTSIGVLIIALLVGHIFHATMNRIAKVEDDYRDMMELKKRAEAADIAKSQFLATVSHEIRTPMNGVLGMLQMLMDTDLDVTQQDYVRTAQASGKALVSLINEVLDQAKIESGKLELEAVRFDLRSIMDDVISLFSGKSHDKGIELGLYISDQVPEILIGDPGRFRQIVTNLVGNSIKFTEKGHIFVSVHLVEEVMNTVEIDSSPTNTLSGLPVVDKHRSFEKLRAFSSEQSTSRKSATPQSSELIHLVVSVEDTGVGIPQEAQSRMFTPFMQVGPSISRIHGGTGIGLSISKCLVDLMKGEIGFASEVQIGSTFSFTAIFTNGSSKLNESKNLHHQETNEKQNDSVTLEFQGMTALVIDPRATRANVTKYHLHRLGIDVKLAKDVDQTFSIVNNSESVINMVLFEQEAWSGFPDVSLLVEKVKRNGQLGLPKIFVLVNSTGSAKIHPTVTTGYPPIVILKPLRACMLAATLRRVTEDGKKRIFHEGGLLHLSSLKKLLHGRHILVVDDNQVNLIVAAGALKKYGAQVTRAKSAKEAIDLLKLPHDFDACFMDIQMPEMDGFQATRRIRQMEKDFNSRITSGELSPEIYRNIERWHLPILAMTADVIQATQEECSKCGMDGYVSKPFEGEHLYREVVRFFSPAASQNQ